MFPFVSGNADDDFLGHGGYSDQIVEIEMDIMGRKRGRLVVNKVLEVMAAVKKKLLEGNDGKGDAMAAERVKECYYK